MLLPCRTQFTNYKYIGIHFKSSLNRVLFFFYFCFPQQLLYSTELNSTSKTSQLRTAVAQRLKQALLAILGLGRTNFSYISVQNLGNPLHEKQLSEKIAGLPFLLMNTLAGRTCQLSQCETIRACEWVNFFSQLTRLSLPASSPIWASEVSLARTREQGAEERSNFHPRALARLAQIGELARRLTRLEGLTSFPEELFSIKTWSNSSNSWRISITTLYFKIFISLTFSSSQMNIL